MVLCKNVAYSTNVRKNLYNFIYTSINCMNSVMYVPSCMSWISITCFCRTCFKSNSLKPTKAKKGLTFRERKIFVFGACLKITLSSQDWRICHISISKKAILSVRFPNLLPFTFIFSLILFKSFNKVVGKNQLNHK